MEDHLDVHSTPQNRKRVVFVSIVDKTQYDFGEDGKNACTSIALTAINQYICSDDPGNVYDIDWENAIVYGVKAWRMWWDVEGHKHGHPFQYVKQIYELPQFKSIRAKLDFVEEYYGTLDQSVNAPSSSGSVTLEHVVETLFVHGESWSAVLTVQCYSFCLICHRLGEIWLFDSHRSLSDPTKSTLAIYRSPELLCTYIRLLFPIQLKVSSARSDIGLKPLYRELQEDKNSFFFTFFKKK